MKHLALSVVLLAVGLSANGQGKRILTWPRLEIKGDFLGETVAQYRANHPDADCDVHKTYANCALDNTVANRVVSGDESFADFEAKRGDVPRLVNYVIGSRLR